MRPSGPRLWQTYALTVVALVALPLTASGLAQLLLIQRETGGNLAELLDNISVIVRARIKLMGEIRTLSAEGKLSAWVLGLLPFATALFINIVNPKFMDVLWTDPVGLKMVYTALAMMVFGVFWMRKIIKIRV